MTDYKPPIVPRAARASYQPSDLPEAVFIHGESAPEVYVPEYPEVAQSKWETEKYHLATATTTAAAPEYSPPATRSPPEDEPKAKVGTIWGLQRRTFIVACGIGGLLVLGIIIAIAVAVVVTRNQQAPQGSNAQGSNRDGNGTQSSSPNGTDINGGGNSPGSVSLNLLAQTSLAAANYTDNNGVFHYYVFAQSNNNALIVSYWDGQNTTWKTLSISQIFAGQGQNIAPMSGTPLTAYAYTNPSFQMRVYFLTDAKVIHELINTDPWLRDSGWRTGSPGFDPNIRITVGSGSGLTALRPQCGTGTDCRNKFPQMAIAYQTSSSVIMLAKAPQWVPQTIGPAENGTVIGMSAMIETDDITDFQWRLNFIQGNLLQEFGSNGALTKWITGKFFSSSAGSFVCWLTTEIGRTFDRIMGSEISISSFPFDLRNIMVLTVEGDGTLWARTFNGQSVQWDQNPLPVVATSGLPARSAFSVAAGSPGKRVYAILDGVVHEWGFISGSEVSWIYIGVVPTAL